MVSLESRNSLGALDILTTGGRSYSYYSVKAAEGTLGELAYLPCCARLFLESLLRFEDGVSITQETMKALCAFYALPKNPPSVPFRPARLLTHDEAAVSLMTDFAALRDEAATMGQPPSAVSSTLPLDVVVERSVVPQILGRERFELLRWGEKNLGPVRLIPPGKGACTPVHIGCLARIVQTSAGGAVPLAYPDAALGTDPHSAALGALGALGWAIDTLEAENLMLGLPLPLTLPRVTGLLLTGQTRKGLGATDLALALVKALTPHDIKGRMLELYGAALDQLSIPDRAVIANALTDAGALGVYVPIDRIALDFLAETGREAEQIALTEAYARAQGLWREAGATAFPPQTIFSQKIELALESLRPGLGCLTGPQSYTPLIESAALFAKTYPQPLTPPAPLAQVRHGDIVWAGLNAALSGGHAREMVTAGLIARKARARGLAIKPWVRASLTLATPFGREVLKASGLLDDLAALGFQAGEDLARVTPQPPTLPPSLLETAQREKILLTSIASGRCEGMPQAIGLNALASPGLVVVYALAGNLGFDLPNKPLAQSSLGADVYLKDLWPSAEEIEAVFAAYPMAPFYARIQSDLERGDEAWQKIAASEAQLYPWPAASTYVRRPPSIPSHAPERTRIRNIAGARLLAVFGDDIASEHIAPSGAIAPDSQAGRTLIEQGVLAGNLGSYGLRSGNYKVMVRGAFQGAGLVNRLAEGQEKGMTFFAPTKEFLTYHEVSKRSRAERKPLMIAAGKNYGHGLRQEWAAKVARLLGVQAILAESFDPEQRRNLIRTGVLPLRMKSGMTLESMDLQAEDVLSVYGLSEIAAPPAEALVTVEQTEGVARYMFVCDLFDEREIAMIKNGGLWAQFIRDLIPLAV